jgi:hypothetical protein
VVLPVLAAFAASISSGWTRDGLRAIPKL